MSNLQGPVAVVTGAGAGLGQAIALKHGVFNGMRAAARHTLHTSVTCWPVGGFDFKSMWLS